MNLYFCLRWKAQKLNPKSWKILNIFLILILIRPQICWSRNYSLLNLMTIFPFISLQLQREERSQGIKKITLWGQIELELLIRNTFELGDVFHLLSKYSWPMNSIFKFSIWEGSHLIGYVTDNALFDWRCQIWIQNLCVVKQIFQNFGIFFLIDFWKINWSQEIEKLILSDWSIYDQFWSIFQFCIFQVQRSLLVTTVKFPLLIFQFSSRLFEKLINSFINHLNKKNWHHFYIGMQLSIQHLINN